MHASPRNGKGALAPPNAKARIQNAPDLEQNKTYGIAKTTHPSTIEDTSSILYMIHNMDCIPDVLYETWR